MKIVSQGTDYKISLFKFLDQNIKQIFQRIQKLMFFPIV